MGMDIPAQRERIFKLTEGKRGAELVRGTVDLAIEVYKSHPRRLDGSEAATHSLGVTLILMESGYTEPMTLATAAGHDFIEDTAMTQQELEEQLLDDSPQVATLYNRIQTLSKVRIETDPTTGEKIMKKVPDPVYYPGIAPTRRLRIPRLHELPASTIKIADRLHNTTTSVLNAQEDPHRVVTLNRGDRTIAEQLGDYLTEGEHWFPPLMKASSRLGKVLKQTHAFGREILASLDPLVKSA
jgi:(p)ppGpp synthase/HD superfamily hydrolase